MQHLLEILDRYAIPYSCDWSQAIFIVVVPIHSAIHTVLPGLYHIFWQEIKATIQKTYQYIWTVCILLPEIVCRLTCIFSWVFITINYRSNKKYVLVLVKCHDVIFTNKINLFGIARVRDECKTQKSQHDTGLDPEPYNLERWRLSFDGNGCNITLSALNELIVTGEVNSIQYHSTNEGLNNMKTSVKRISKKCHIQQK